MTRAIFKSAWSLQTATMPPGKWQDELRPLVDERGNVIGIVSAKLDASTALAMSGSLPENVNYAVKSSLLLSFLESVPDVDAKLKAPNTADEKFEEVVKSAQDAAVLVLVY
jgi:S1-C subfamily serine protease